MVGRFSSVTHDGRTITNTNRLLRHSARVKRTLEILALIARGEELRRAHESPALEITLDSLRKRLRSDANFGGERHCVAGE
jgi:hypothetical protein